MTFWGGLFFFSICLFLLIFLCLAPLIINICELKWYFQIIMYLGIILAGFTLSFLKYVFCIPGSIGKFYFYMSPLIILHLLGLLSLSDFELWGLKYRFIGVIFVWIMFIAIYLCMKVLLNKLLFGEKTPILLSSLAILLLIVGLILNLTTDDIIYIYLLKIGIGIIYLIAIVLYINKYIYDSKNPKKILSEIVGITFWGSFLTIFFPFYVRWCGLSKQNFEIFLPIYTALLGGGITLAGVAWTIKNSNDDKKRDLILQNKPIMYPLIPKKNDINGNKPINLVFLDLNEPMIVSKFYKFFNIEMNKENKDLKNKKNEQLELVHLTSIVNTDNSIVMINKIMVNNIELTPLNNNVIAKGMAYNFVLTISDLSEENDIKLYVSDVLKNQYCFKLYVVKNHEDIKIKKYMIIKIEEQFIV